MTSPTHYLPHLSTPFQQKFPKEFSEFIDPIILSWTLSDHVFVSIHSMKMPVNPIQCWFLGLLSCSINIIYSSWSFSSRSNFFFHLASRAQFQSSCSVISDSLQPHGLQHARLPCPSPTPRAFSNSCSWSQWYHPTILSSVVPFSSHLQSFQH